MAILAAVLVPTITSKIKDANSSAAKSDVSSVASGIQSDLMSIQAGQTSSLTYFAPNTKLEDIDATADVIMPANSGINVAVAGDVITLSKAGGGDTWTVTINIKTGAVSAPTNGDASQPTEGGGQTEGGGK
jgi:hypothetical protein